MSDALSVIGSMVFVLGSYSRQNLQMGKVSALTTSNRLFDFRERSLLTAQDQVVRLGLLILVADDQIPFA